jgi:hypothetical protein
VHNDPETEEIVIVSTYDTVTSMRSS